MERREEDSSAMRQVRQFRELVRRETPDGAERRRKLKYAEQIARKDLPGLMRDAGIPMKDELAAEFCAEYDKFIDFLLYAPLAGKSVVGIGGCDSENRLLFWGELAGGIFAERKNLPEAIPIYAVRGWENTVRAINIFGERIPSEHCMSCLPVNPSDDTGIFSGSLKHLVKNILVETEQLAYENLAFLDTVEYRASDFGNPFEPADGQAQARQQLNAADYILWFLPDGGNQPSGILDAGFLKTLNREIPVVLLCDAGDMEKEQREKCEAALRSQAIAENLALRDIVFLDLKSQDKSGREKLQELLCEWDRSGKGKNAFAVRFKCLFRCCRDYCIKKKEEIGAEIRNLKKALACSEDAEVYIGRVLAGRKEELARIAAYEKEVLRLQKDFFKEVGFVADEAGIQMREPEDAEILGHKISDPLSVLERYNESQGVTVSPEMKELAWDMARNIKPEIERNPGGSRYREVVGGIVANIPFPMGDEIKFGVDTNYRELIGNVLNGTENRNAVLKDEKED